jgi:hypothetical protein
MPLSIRRGLTVLLVAAFAGCWFTPYPQTRPVAQQGPRVVQVAPQQYPAPTNPQVTTVTPVNPNPPAGPVQVTLVNNTGLEVCYLYVSVAGEPWGADQLGESGTIPVGTQVTLELPGEIPAWDVRADDCNRQTLYDVRSVGIPYNGVWELVAMFGAPSGSYYPSSTVEPTYEPSTVEPTYEPATTAPAVDRRLGVVAGWFLGASMSDIEDLLRGDCGFIDNGDLQDFCRGDCGFIDNGDVQDLCRGDCGFIDDGDLQDFCRGDCGFIDNGDLQDFCRGDCGFIDDSNMANACRAL